MRGREGEKGRKRKRERGREGDSEGGEEKREEGDRERETDGQTERDKWWGYFDTIRPRTGSIKENLTEAERQAGRS